MTNDPHTQHPAPKIAPTTTTCGSCNNPIYPSGGGHLHTCPLHPRNRQSNQPASPPVKCPDCKTDMLDNQWHRCDRLDARLAPPKPATPRGWYGLKPQGAWEWVWATIFVIFGLSFPVFGIILIICFIYIAVKHETSTPATEAAEQARYEAKRRQKAQADLRWCVPCGRNIRPVRRATASKLILTGGAGYAMSDRDMCPICKSQFLESARSVA